MKVELSIKSDKELRDHIKDCIKGQVVSIARSEIKSILAEVTRKHVSGLSVDGYVREIVKNEVEKALEDWNGKKHFIRELAMEYVRENVTIALKE